jgi:anhydro-N-acetylmuramic acid kinase
MQVYKVLGVMSGTSLDGLDIAYCELVKAENWNYKIVSAITIPYSEKRKKILAAAIGLSGEELASLDAKFGKYIGEECNKMISEHGLRPDFISSHGHTVFHQPKKGFTLQIGSGAQIYAETGLPVICDYRRQDVAMGGQGAPLVPIGDQLLFNDSDACLNLGGFANISTQRENKRIAWDICAVNVVLNFYASKAGLDFDEGGGIASGGSFYEKLYTDLGKLNFYREAPPKSLGIEWVKEQLMHILEKYPIPVEDILHTYTCHIAEQIGNTLDQNHVKKVLVTGGGAYNHFLVEKIQEKTPAIIHIPDDLTIQYKEALIFALLGVLKCRGEVNVLSSVTGAREDHSSGITYGKFF